MEIEFTPQALQEFEYWKNSGQQGIISKIKSLIESIIETPYQGIGKPEALKHNLWPKWSRRINKEHRLVYEVREGILYIFSLKGHYE